MDLAPVRRAAVRRGKQALRTHLAPSGPPKEMKTRPSRSDVGII